MYDMGQDERLEMGQRGSQYVIKNYNFKEFQAKWVDLMLKLHEKEGSWETRKNYSTITFKEVA